MSTTDGEEVSRIVLFYNIACQYCQNFYTRMKNYCNDMAGNLSDFELEFIIPVFHINGHGIQCQTRYSFYYRNHMGRTDGKNIERGWAAFNPASMQVKEMGPGSRRDVLNFQFGHFNWVRIRRMGKSTYHNTNNWLNTV